MSTARIQVRGEVFVTLESAAECYQVETGWIREVYAQGLMGPGETVGGSIAVPERALGHRSSTSPVGRPRGRARPPGG